MITKLVLIALITFTSFASEIVIKKTMKLEKKPTLVRDNATNTLTDTTTGIVWEDDNRFKKNWSDAKEYCEDLTLGGSDEWHLPTISELETIADYSEYKPALKGDFDTITTNMYWSLSTDASNGDDAWFVLFENGRSYTLDKTKKASFKCVNTQKKNPSIIKRDGDLVTDSATGIMWQDSSEAKSIETDFKGAEKYCKELSLGGYDDWYLPKVEQLLSITDKEKANPSIKEEFKNTFPDGYWTSSVNVLHSSNIWYVHFGYGFSSDYGKRKLNRHVRCARAGNEKTLTFKQLVSKLAKIEKNSPKKLSTFDKLVSKLEKKEMGGTKKPSRKKTLEEIVLKKALEIVWGKPHITKLKYKRRKGYFVGYISFDAKADFDQKIHITIAKDKQIGFKRNMKYVKPEAVFEYDGSSVKLKDVRIKYEKVYYSSEFVKMNLDDTKENINIGKDIKFD